MCRVSLVHGLPGCPPFVRVVIDISLSPDPRIRTSRAPQRIFLRSSDTNRLSQLSSWLSSWAPISTSRLERIMSSSSAVVQVFGQWDLSVFDSNNFDLSEKIVLPGVAPSGNSQKAILGCSLLGVPFELQIVGNLIGVIVLQYSITVVCLLINSGCSSLAGYTPVSFTSKSISIFPATSSTSE